MEPVKLTTMSTCLFGGTFGDSQSDAPEALLDPEVEGHLTM